MDPTRRSYSQENPIIIDTLGQGQRLAGGTSRDSYGASPETSYPLGAHDPGSGRPPVEIILTPEDWKIMRECNRQSFYQRCLPLIFAGNALAYTAFSRATEPVSTRKRVYGYIAVTATAWFIGKMSYRRVCEDKILTSGYSSPLVESVRKRRGMGPSSADLHDDFNDDNTPVFDWKEDDRQSVLKDDKNRNESQFDDGHIGDKPFYGDDMSSDGSDRKEYTSYDVLRQQNRSRVAVDPKYRQPDDRRSF